jgi:hypothetical protein
VIASLTSLGFGVVATIEDRCWGCGRLDILQQRRYHSVGDIGGQVHSLTYFLLLPVIICVPNRDLAWGNVNRRFERTSERRAFLDEVVFDDLEFVALRKFGRFLVNGTVLEAKYKFGGYAIARRILNKVTSREGLPLKRLQHDKAVQRALRVVHADLVCP